MKTLLRSCAFFAALSITVGLSAQIGSVVHINFDGNVKDVGPMHNDGVATDITYGPDRFGRANRAGVFNGTSSDVSLSMPDSVRYSKYTYAFWVKAEEAVSGTIESVIASVGNEEADQYLVITTDTRGYAMASYYGAWPKTTGVQSYTLPEFGKWEMIVVSRDADSLRIFVNGKQKDVKEVPADGAVPYYGNGAIWATIGSRGKLSNRYFTGSLDNFRFYPRAFKENDAAQLYTEDTKQPSGIDAAISEKASYEVFVNNGMLKVNSINTIDAISVMDMAGKLVAKVNTGTLDVSGLNGLYIVSVQSGTDNLVKKVYFQSGN